MAAREIWAKRVRQWVASDMTAVAFAATHGFNARTLIYWKWRLGKDARDAAAIQRAPVREAAEFVEVTPPSSWWRATDRIEVVVDEDVVVRVPNDFDDRALRRVLVVLDVLEEGST